MSRRHCIRGGERPALPTPAALRSEFSHAGISCRSLELPFSSRAVPQVLPASAGLRCSPATAAALRAADLVRAGGGLISMPVALIASGANLRYAYLALGLSVSERELVEAGFESLRRDLAPAPRSLPSHVGSASRAVCRRRIALN